MKKRKLLLLFMASISTFLAIGQSIDRFAISSAGDYNSGSGIQLSWTLGQSSIVETFSNSSAILTQGFQQPSLTTSLSEELPMSFSLSVYPNPSMDEFNFDFSAESDGKIAIQIYDMNGRQILSDGEFNTYSGSWNHQINLNQLSVGIYHCRFLFESDEGNTAIKDIKLSVIK